MNSVIYILVFISDMYFANSQISIESYNALKSLYLSTNGTFWTWNVDQSPTTRWNFTVEDLFAPCTIPWQGVTCSSGVITQLNLQSYNLQGSLPLNFGGLLNLTNLNLGSNKITGTIPPSISNMTFLSLVTFKNNHLTGVIPSALCSIAPHLSTFDLTENSLYCYPACLSKYISYLISITKPIVLDSSVVSCVSQSPSIVPFPVLSSNSSTSAFFTEPIVIIVSVCGGCGLIGLFMTVLIIARRWIPGAEAYLFTEIRGNKGTGVHMGDWFKRFGESAHTKTAAEDLSSYWKSDNSILDLTLSTTEARAQPAVRQLGAASGRLLPARTVSARSISGSERGSVTPPQSTSPQRTSYGSASSPPARSAGGSSPPFPFGPPTVDVGSSSSASGKTSSTGRPSALSGDTIGAITGVTLRFTATANVAVKGHRVRLLPSLQSLPVDLVYGIAPLLVVETREAEGCLWGRVSPSLLLHAFEQAEYESYSHGWSLLHSPDKVFWKLDDA